MGLIILLYSMTMLMGLSSMILTDTLMILVAESIFTAACITFSAVSIIGTTVAEMRQNVSLAASDKDLKAGSVVACMITAIPLAISLFMGFYITAGFLLLALICTRSYVNFVRKYRKEKGEGLMDANLDNVIVVNKKHWKSGSKGQIDCYIGRPSPFGNPFMIGRDGDRNEVINKYYTDFFIPMWQSNDLFRQALYTMAALASEPGTQIVLVCWCAPKPCHGDVIKKCLDCLIEHGDWDPENHPFI